MQLKIICIGKTGKKFLEDGEAEYLSRLSKYISTEVVVLPDIRNAKSLSEAQIKEAEARQFLSRFSDTDLVYLLDENGRQFGSVEFAQFLQENFNRGGKSILFLIGGPYGFDAKLHQRAQGKISLSKMTFSHQMIRMFFLEQLYRAMTILKNEPYHHQ